MVYYHSLNSFLKERFGEKVYKLALDGGFSCPNRDGTLSSLGCIFCLEGSGGFATRIEPETVFPAIERAKARVAQKGASRYIAYYQSYTSTYAPVGRLDTLFSSTIAHPDVCGLAIATRPDCLEPDTVRLLSRLNRKKPVWVELGLQTIHDRTADYIRRGYPLEVYKDAVSRLSDAGIPVVTHMIIGLPGESAAQTIETADFIGRSGSWGVKFQLLHVLRGTDLARDYMNGAFSVLSLEEYVSILEACVSAVSPQMVIHRLTGDGRKADLLAPLWSADKKTVLNRISERIRPYP